MQRGAQFVARVERRGFGESHDGGLTAGAGLAGFAKCKPGSRPSWGAVDRLFEKFNGGLKLAGLRIATRIIEAPVRDQIA